MEMTYRICIDRCPSNYSAYSPEVPGCIATGDSRAEVTRNLKSAIRFHLAEEIRQFVGDKYIKPLRKTGGGFVNIRAGDVCKAMNLNRPMRAVCDALDTKLFREFFKVDLVAKTGPQRGADTLFTFKVRAPSSPMRLQADELLQELRG